MSITHTFRAPSRRGLLLGMTGLAVGSQVLGMPFISRGLANTPIKIGVGALPANAVGGAGARFVRFGAADALHQVKGKVLGQAVQLVPFDEADVAATQAAFKTLIGEHKVAGIIGGASDETALELLKLAGEAKIPLVIHTAQTDEITGKGCNRWTYRVPIPLGAQFRAIKPYLATYGKKWFTMTGS